MNIAHFFVVQIGEEKVCAQRQHQLTNKTIAYITYVTMYRHS